MAVTLQWTVVATFLFGEIGVICLMLLPWIRPQQWQKLFRSRIARGLSAYTHIYTPAVAGILLLLFADAARDCRRYMSEEERTDSRYSQGGDMALHMRLFRAQRNLYISGFALFLWLVIRRLMQLIAREAQLQASAEAAIRQAANAAQSAAGLMDANPDERVQQLEKELKEARRQVATANADRDAMKEQAENLRNEYDRLLDQLHGDDDDKQKDD